MGIFGKTIAAISPGWAAKRARSRMQLFAYEAAMPTRTQAARREPRSAEVAVFAAGVSLREQARWLDENHDIAIGILDKLEERVVGAAGIQIEPQPLTVDGKVHEDFAALMSTRFAEWAVHPDVTGLYNLAEAERMMLRSAVRDGEVFTQLVRGKVAGIEYSTPEQLAIEMLEADFVPFELTGMQNGNTRTVQGIDVNAWGRPLAYNVYMYHPTSGIGIGRMKKIPTDRMLHLAVRKRLHQLRGVSMLHGVITRLADIKSYEEYERVAARIAASLGFYIKRGDASTYDDETESKDETPDGTRLFDMSPGTIYDGLAAGEDLGMLESSRPNVHLPDFRNGQLRAVAAGTRTGYSSISRDYNGNYSAQRQELVETFEGYTVLQDWFVAQIVRPIYRAWVDMFLLSGVDIPPEIDRESLYNAVYLGPVMPWIDPTKESAGWKTQIRGGAATESEWTRARGRNPMTVKRQRLREVEFNREHGLVFDTDPANDKGPITNETTQEPAAPTAGQQPGEDD